MITRFVPAVAVLLALASASLVLAQPAGFAKETETTVTATGEAVGTSASAKEEAKLAALRKCVEQGCGVFIKSKTKTEDYKTVYDKIIANTPGYIVRYDLVKEWQADGNSYATVKAVVSTRKFEEDWVKIAHTLHQEGNPRVIIAIAETTYTPATQWATEVKEVKECGAVQSKLEDFFLSKDVQLVDKATAESVSKRDILLASLKDDVAEVAALGAKFKAEVVLVGQASAKFTGKEVNLNGAKLYQYVAVLNVRAIQCDTAKVLVSKSFGPYTVNATAVHGGEDKAMAKIGEDAPAEVLKALVEAWRKKVNVQRVVQLSISGMDYALWKKFKTEVEKIDGVNALRLREITESVAAVEVEYKWTNERLAERLSELADVKLTITELNADRLKLKVVK
jgi:hypothetical protein